MSGDFVFTVYGLILHAEEYFSINKNMTAGEKIFYIVLLTKRGRGLLTKAAYFLRIYTDLLHLAKSSPPCCYETLLYVKRGKNGKQFRRSSF